MQFRCPWSARGRLPWHVQVVARVVHGALRVACLRLLLLSTAFVFLIISVFALGSYVFGVDPKVMGPSLVPPFKCARSTVPTGPSLPCWIAVGRENYVCNRAAMSFVHMSLLTKHENTTRLVLFAAVLRNRACCVRACFQRSTQN